METTGEKLRAFGLATLVHLLAFGLLFVGFLWTRQNVQVAIPGPVIEATLVGPAQAPKPRAEKPQPPRPEPPKPEPPKPEPPKPETPQEPVKPDTVDREKIAEMALQKAEQEKKAEEERRKQRQILLDEQKKKDEAAKKLAEEKKQKLEKERLAQFKDQEKKNRKLEQQRLSELMEAEEATTGQEGKDDSLLAQYFASLQNVVFNSWLRPENAQPGLHCVVRIVQIPGGEVLSARVTSPCNADPLTRQTIEQAVMRASPLPYKGYEDVFLREINFNFTYDG